MNAQGVWLWFNAHIERCLIYADEKQVAAYSIITVYAP